MDTKICIDCAAPFPLTKFYSNGASGYKPECRHCSLIRMKVARIKHPQRRAEIQYGMERGEYQQRHDVQGGVCAICGGTNADGRALYVDHCHATGTVRGLLCGRCNFLLGHSQDNIAILKKAVAYLEGCGSDPR
jgi:hypothetical protein